VDAWLERTGHDRGAVVSFEQMWALAQRWYEGRMKPGWRGRSAEEAQRVLDDVGLSGDFWSLG
jgi:hypothetical protein